jgi:hypothetical protein
MPRNIDDDGLRIHEDAPKIVRKCRFVALDTTCRRCCRHAAAMKSDSMLQRAGIRATDVSV